MITDEELAALPDDPDLAFVEFERKLRERVNEQLEDENESVAREYIAHVHAFVDEFGLQLPTEDPPLGQLPFWSYYTSLRRHIDYFSARARLRASRGAIAGVVDRIYLSDDYRAQIHKLLNTIRKIVNAAEIETRLRDRILKQLNILATEVDRSMSRLSAFTSVYLEVTDAIGQGAENLEPVVSKMERIARIFGRARAENENGTLPPPEKPKLISGPATDAESIAQSESPENLDDDIPF